MANQQQDNLGTANNFTGGLVTDPVDILKKSDTYSAARNMSNYLPNGKFGGKNSEQGTIQSAAAPYTVIGRIFLTDDQWVIFSTNNTYSEVGLFNDAANTYTTYFNDIATIAAGLPGLNFHTDNLITGQARRGYDCGFDVYWSDGRRNPDRMFNTTFLQPNPWFQNCVTVAGCITCTNTNRIDIQQLRLAPLMSTPCLKLSKHKGSGQLLNGTYQVAVAYAVNSIKCTDYITFSDVYSTWTHIGQGTSINLTIGNIDNATKIRFTEMEVVVISMINNQVQAKRLGIYSTNTSVLTISNLDEELVTIPLSTIPLSNPAIVYSDAIFGISNYLTRVGVQDRPDPNYQPFANQIVTKWVAVEYPEDYYHKGGDDFGMNVGYLRGEVYAFFIRGVYDTGDKTASYVIPGRPNGSPATISLSVFPPSTDSGRPFAAGLMEGWESTELYPDRQVGVWGTLCGRKIRWHKFPDQSTFVASGGGNILSHYNPQNFNTISVLGVFFENIPAFRDLNNNIIPDIVGYEILRATRDGHESIVAKGQINHMRSYVNPDGSVGLYQNYPYNDLGPDFFLTSSQSTGTIGPTHPKDNNQNEPLTTIQWDTASFHSPDTVFATNKPFLGQGTLQLVQVQTGVSKGSFSVPYKHPKFKLLSNTSTVIADIISGIAALVTAISVLTGGSTNLSLAATEDVPLLTPLGVTSVPTLDATGAGTSALIIALNIAQAALAVVMFPLQFKTIQQQILNVFSGLAPARQFAIQYNSHGLYDLPVPVGRAEIGIGDYQYIQGYLQTFQNLTVNNLYRNKYVLLGFRNALGAPQPIPAFPTGYNFGEPKCDVSRFTLGSQTGANLLGPYSKPIVSWYGAYKVAQPAQYGQIDSTKQVAIGCVQKAAVGAMMALRSPIFFGGDTYINRYTEKNPMMFFNDWLVDTPSDFQYDYTNYENVPFPRYWVNNSKIYADFWGLASRNYHLDRYEASDYILGIIPGFYVKEGYFYLFNNGVRDFFVESSVNVGYRDWEEDLTKRFYDPYGFTATDYLFRSDIIKNDILYKYDYSLSANRFINQYISWGQCLRRDYNPSLAYTCFSYYPRRVHYSLPQEEEQLQDNWRLFLPNNYKDFPDKVTVIKDLHKTGAIFLMESDTPMMFAGVETMPSKNNTEYTVGTGLLFEQSLQSITNVDSSYEYASCQSRLGVINTPYGIYWVSQDTGRIFNYSGGKLIDVGEEAGHKFWLLNYLPSKLNKLFPLYPHTDNPVAGVGVQLIYDSILEILYICKKDYVLKPGISLYYIPGTGFSTNPCPPGTCPAGRNPDGSQACIQYLSGGPCPGYPTTTVIVTIGDPAYFEDASWTLSYDCRKKEFVSNHDWFPSMNIPSKNHFFTTNKLSGRFWRHNNTSQLFCNYYGVDYPCEIEYYAGTQLTESILQSVEYILESYQYAPNGVDRFLNYDESFDQMMVRNEEQNSGLQDMVLKPYNNPYATLNFPFFIGPTRNIYYNKVENVYRVNDYYDYTRDRGEFTLANIPMLTTHANGYTFNITTGYLDVLKPVTQQKRFRYRGTKIFFRKTKLGKNSLSILSTTSRNVKSWR